MKLTKSTLKQLIKEVMEEWNEREQFVGELAASCGRDYNGLMSELKRLFNAEDQVVGADDRWVSPRFDAVNGRNQKPAPPGPRQSAVTGRHTR